MHLFDSELLFHIHYPLDSSFFLFFPSDYLSYHLLVSSLLLIRSLLDEGHGSNVQGIETEAIYDHSRREFIINTPHDRAQKYWIGNAACTLHICFLSNELSVIIS